MPITANSTAPYTSPSAVITVIERYRDRGLQTPFTVDVLQKAGVSSGLAPRTLQALELLGLIDADGMPTEQFVALRQAPEDEVRGRFAALLQGAYAEVFSFIDPKQDSRERIRDAFRSYQPHGQQERMVTLFLGLCEWAGLVDETPGRSVGAPRPGARGPRARTPQAAQAVASGKTDPGTWQDTPLTTLFTNVSTQQAAGAHALIQGLLRELPPVGATWPEAKMRTWLDTQRAVFNLLYKIGDDTSPEPVPESGGESDS